MNCNCIEDIEKRLIGKKLTKSVTMLDAKLLQVGKYGSKNCLSTYTKVEYKTDNEQGKTKKIKLYHNFCPFCGKKYDLN